ncbi:MAG: hypothetical protein PHU56_04095 [Candidatus Pacebacteria bacterium]|nr:hypothetical protein [Candidatus Paceibacterota bacterium]
MAYWKYPAYLLLLYLLVILQTSFLPQLSLWGCVCDLVFLAVFLFVFLNPRKKRFAYVSAVFGGLMLEANSNLPFFGLWIAALLLAVLSAKKLSSAMQGSSVFSLCAVFSAAFLCFKSVPWVLLWLFTLAQKKILLFPSAFSWKELGIAWLFDLAAVIVCFYVYEFFHQRKNQRN